MNAAAIQDIRRIWCVTTIQRDERTMMLTNWLALAAVVLGAMGAGLAILQHRASPLACCVCWAGAAPSGWASS